MPALPRLMGTQVQAEVAEEVHRAGKRFIDVPNSPRGRWRSGRPDTGITGVAYLNAGSRRPPATDGHLPDGGLQVDEAVRHQYRVGLVTKPARCAEAKDSTAERSAVSPPRLLIPSPTPRVRSPPS